MHVALPYTCVSGDSGYLSDTAITVLTLADILQSICNVNVTLVCMNVDGTKWWPDYEHFRLVHSVIGYSPDLQFDAVVDVQCQMSHTLRRRMTRGSVIGFRYDNCLIDEIQDFTYQRAIFNTHNLRGELDAMWVWADNVDVGQIPVLEELYGCPVVRMPFIMSWRLAKLAADCSAAQSVALNPLRFTVVATNTDSTSSMVIPLVGLNSLPQVEACRCIGSKGVQDTSFYKDNIFQHLHYKSAIQYTDAMRLPVPDRDDGSVWISHARFVRFLPHQIHLAWMYGHRLVHNSPVLERAGVAAGFFPNNSMGGMVSAIEAIRESSVTLDAVREAMVERLCERDSSSWRSAFKRRIRITFSDMWEGFNPSVNFFVDMIRWMGDWDEVVGEVWTGGGAVSDLHICGPFGFVWKSLPASTPIVFFSGERWERNPVYESDSRIRLFLTHDPVEDERHIRFPLWITYLKLFGNEIEGVKQNPMRAPLDWATTSQVGEGGDRAHFCAFVASNPKNPIRNDAFTHLNQYKKVDSGGQCMNTIGGPIEALYGGGGGGELAKLAFYRKRQFCIAFENSGAPGYVTEKLLHAKMAGCIPIYWGDEMACTDFDARGFISMCGKAPHEIVGLVDELLHDPAQCAYMASIPPLGEKELRAVWDRIETVGARIRGILTRRGDGAVVHKESAREIGKMSEPTGHVPPVRHAPLFVSFATRDYIPSIMQSLDTLKLIRTRECPGLQYLLYMGGDVTDADVEPIQSIGSWISIRKLPTDTSPAGDAFPDFWAAHHFGWKLWILNQIVHEFTDKLIVYSDADAQWQKMYDEMFTKAWDTGACFVTDHNLNKHWCSPAMVASMNVTTEELEAQQILAGIIAIRGGDMRACAFFKECYQLGLNPVNLKGRKLIRILPSGQPIGHHHDQSIMSVMRARKGSEFGTVDVDKATCCESLRRTHLTGCPIYLHRGSYTVHKRPLPRTDDVWIVNLNRRLDRIQQWAEAYPELAAITQRFQAIDGRGLHMTPAISELFQRNDFKWKRPVIGCALSHILLWTQLACETSAVESYLILEDDMRFGCEDWANALQDALGSLPDDVDVAMLGGVLPKNRLAYAEAITPVNDVWATIKPNKLFTPFPAPIFHHCTYSYYLTKRGAKKLLRALLTGEGGCFTSIDLFLGFPHNGLVKYVMTQPIVKCFQDSDPRYVNSEFDNFDRVDSFDSDIWNNNEVFSQTDRECGTIYGARQSLYPVLSDVLRQVPSDIQTRSLLEPEQYMRAVVGDEGGEMEFLRTFAKILENEVSDPATIRIWQRKNVCCIAEGDSGINESVLAEICGDDVKIVRASSDGAYVCAKLFAVHPAMTVQEIVDRVDMTGCIPLYLRAEGDDVFWGQLRGTLPVMELRNEEAVRKFIAILAGDLKKAEMYRVGLLQKVRGGGA